MQSKAMWLSGRLLLGDSVFLERTLHEKEASSWLSRVQ